MKGIAARFGWCGAGFFCLVTVGWVLASPPGKPAFAGLPMDWTHRHVIFSQPATPEQARLMADEPRYWQQEYRRSILRVLPDEAEQTNSLGLALKGLSRVKIHRDYMEGNMRGPSSQDCEKSFAKTGIPSANMLEKKLAAPNLIQIKTIQIQPAQLQPLPAMAGATA